MFMRGKIDLKAVGKYMLIFSTVVVAVWGALIIFHWVSDARDKVVDHTRDVYVQRIESKFHAAREELAIEVDNYIKAVAPKSNVDALNIIDLCTLYDVDLRLVLVQGHVESHFATKGTARRTNSIFNVGAFDGHSARKQIKNGYGYKHPDYSVEPYLKLLVTDYLVDGKTELDLLQKFVNKNGQRYASATNYEAVLKKRWDMIDEYANITETYETYRHYALLLGC